MRLPENLAAGLEALAHRLGLPVIVPLLAGWAVLLARWSDQDDLVIGARVPSHSPANGGPTPVTCTRTVGVRCRLHGEPTVKQFLTHVKSGLRKAASHQDAGFEGVADDLRRSGGSIPSLQATIALDAIASDEPVTRDGTKSALELALSLAESADGFSGTLEYASELFAQDTIGRLLAGWKVVLGAITEDICQPIGSLPVMPETERCRVLHEFNATAVDYPRDRLIHELFEEQVRRTPEAVAVEHGGRQLSYGQLNRRANQLARYLVSHGIGPDQVVGICLERGLELAVAVLATLKSGGAYLPLDPSYPTERLRQMLEDAVSPIVLTETELMGVLPASVAKTIALDAELGQTAGFVADNVPAADLGLSPERLVYVIYTSGSTGRPKGTAMGHRSMVNLIEWHRKRFGSSSGQRVLQFAALSFDVAFQEIFSTLCTGGTLVLLDEWVRRDARALAEFLESHSIHRLFLPPLMLQSLAEHVLAAGEPPPHIVPPPSPERMAALCSAASRRLATLQDIITAGEQLRVTPKVRKLFRQLPGARLHNHYGPTETHVVTALTLDGEPSTWPGLPSIGRPIANTQIYVLDSRMQPVPIGVTGEIHIGGDNLARGYLNRPQLTEERFVADPFCTDPGARLYKTGDRGRWGVDGTLEYLGRNDDQVKVRGFRIELGEIEARLASHEQVREAAVVVREDSPGGKRLLAYVTPTGESCPAPEELRTYVEAMLPDYMVPSAFVTLAKLPLTPNGKLDRRSLPAPSPLSQPSPNYESPQGEVEMILARVWQELLQVERIGRRDNFFALGGDSLQVMRMLERLRAAGLSADARDAYKSATLADQARVIARRPPPGRCDIPPNLIPPHCEAITPQMLPLADLEPRHIERIAQAVSGGAGNIQDIYPLAPLQEGILLDHLLSNQGAHTYIVATLLLFASRDRMDRFISALQEVIDRHDALRTAVLWEGLPRPLQVVQRRARLSVEEIIPDPGDDVLERLKERMGPERIRVDPCRAPLMRLLTARDPASSRWYASLLTHHLVCDNESLQAVMSEVRTRLGNSADLLPAPIPYRVHVALTLARARDLDFEHFFRAKLADVDEPTASFGIMHSPGRSRRLAQCAQSLPPELALRMRAIAPRWGVDTGTLLHAAWALVVAITSGRDDVVFGTVLLGRMHGGEDARAALGMFINTLPIRLRLQGASARELIIRTQRELADLLEHDCASLPAAQRCSAVTAPIPLFNSIFNYVREAAPLAAGVGTLSPGIDILTTHEWTSYPLTMSVYDSGSALHLISQADEAIGPPRLVDYIATALRSLLDALELAPDTSVLQLKVIPDTERSLLVDEFNDTAVEYPHNTPVHRLFEARTAHAPDGTAVTVGGRAFTYSELNREANRLARHLCSLGATSGEFIPVLMPRSLGMIIAELAVLKCGCAYVPLDPEVPAERLRFILRDCGARRVVVAGASTAASLPERGLAVDCFASSREIGAMPSDDLALAGSSSGPAYLMYTSGSTGVPKGVIVPHRAINRLAINGKYADIRPTDCIAHCSNPAFDASTFEVWAALLNGARLVIVPQAVLLDPKGFVALIAEEGVTILFMTAGLFSQYADELAPLNGRLRYLLTGGDVVDPGAVRRVMDVCRPEFIVNAYGPTECTTFATTYPVHAADLETSALPIGRPISNTTIYILDGHARPVPVGVSGEIYVGGPGVALGYLNRPELNGERFLPDQFGRGSSGRLYRTGDVGRWRADGNIEFLGRNDRQVKIRGFRIEPGEVESQLSRHPGVRQAVVAAHAQPRGPKRLVAYFTARGGSAPSSEELRDHLHARLPEYMIPSTFIPLESLPLTANGKIDRRSLPEPKDDARIGEVYEPPSGEIEQVVADIWARVLSVESVGRNDHFFDGGGHSLLATQMVLRVRDALGARISVQDVFEEPILRRFAARVVERCRDRLIEELTQGGKDVDELVGMVIALTDSQARDWMKELNTGERQCQ